MSGSKEPPHLPDVVDEAGDSPSWVPVLGIGLLCLVALLVALRQAQHELAPEPPPAAAMTADGGTAGEAAPEPEAAVEKPAGEKPAGEKPAAPAE